MSYNKIRKETESPKACLGLAEFIKEIFGPLAPWQERHLETVAKQIRMGRRL